MIEPCRVPIPSGLLNALRRLRRDFVAEHWVAVNARWWNDALADKGRPGGPLAVTYDHQGHAGISRGALFELAKFDTAEDVFRLLWHTLAWGGGMRARLMNKRLDNIVADRNKAVSALATATALARTSPANAYDVLYPRRRTLFKYLGPAFFTKYLYFAGGGAPAHPCLILDRVIANALRSAGWIGLEAAGWSSSAYLQYCDLLACWATHTGTRLARAVPADEIELCLFEQFQT